MLLVISIIPVSLTLLFQSPIVQTITARLAADYLSKDLDQEIRINSIKIGIFSGINVVGLDVRDHHNNTLIGIGRLSALPELSNFSFSNLRFETIKIDSVQFIMGSYKDEDNSNLNLLINSFRSESSSGNNAEFRLYVNSLSVTNSKFNLFNENRDYDGGDKTIDYANIIIDNIDGNIDYFTIVNDSLNFRVNELTANEKSGIQIKKMSSDISISSSSLKTTNGLIALNNSNIDLDFEMLYSSYQSMSYYIDSVVMIGDIRPTTIDMADIGYFADILFEMPNIVGVTGKMKGTVTDLVGTDLKIKYGDNTRVSGDVKFVGLPDFFTSYMTGENLRLTSNSKDISAFFLPIESKHIDVSSILPEGEQVTVFADFKGYYEDFNSKLNVVLNHGSIVADIDYKTKNNYTTINASLVSDSLAIGKFLNMNDILGQTSFDLKVNVAGDDMYKFDYNVSGKITNTDILGYNYRRIGVIGSYIDDSVKAEIRVGDKNLMMVSNIIADIGNNQVYDLSANIVKANLHKLHLWSDQPLTISSIIDANIVGTDIKTLDADIFLKNNTISFTKHEYKLDSISLTKHTNSDMYTITELSSGVIDATAKGEYDLSTVSNSFIELIDNYFDIIPGDDSTRIKVDKNIELDMVIRKPKILTEQFFSGIAIAPNTSLKSKIDFTTNKLDLDLISKKIRINDVILDTNKLIVFTHHDKIISEFSIDNLILKDSTPTDSVVLGIDNFSISSRIGDDSITYGINWKNWNQTTRNSGEIEGYIARNNDSTLFNFGKANVFINDLMWDIDTNNLVLMYDNKVYFHDFFINAGKSRFKLIGTLPRTENDSLMAQFKDWDLSNFDLITKPMNLDLDGQINGELKLSIIHDNPTLISNINITDLGLNDEYLGDANIINTWDNSTNSIFLKSQIIRKGNVGKGEIFKADGYYQPLKDKDNLKIDVSFDKFKIRTFEPFLSSFVNEIEGTTSGNLKIRGSSKKPIIEGSANMQRAGLRVVYLNTKYSFTNSIDFVKNGVTFDKLVIYDTLGNQAQINGSLTHNYFSDPKFDIEITTPGLLFFNTSQHMNDLYYGSAIASGKIDITGSPTDVDLNINVRTQRGTSVVLPMDYSVEISDKDYIIFTKKAVDTIVDENQFDISATKKEDELQYNINVNLEVTPIAQVGINLPDDMGTISVRGNSNLAMDVNSNGEFSLVGDYIVEDGLFAFSIGNLVSKRFSIVNGGRISWTGNPYSAQVNIKGLYKVKTSLSSLGVQIDTTASYKNKVTVECYVVLTGELLNPNIKFEIQIPDLDPDFQRAVFSELDTTNTAMMNQQMISLLVLGTFSFNNAANVSLQSSYYNVIANQLSSMLSQISDNVDIGLNYKPGDNVSQEEFEVALSTQLFDDRLTIDGNFGMTYDRTDQSASNIVGDVDVGYKLTPDGQWILKVFNHSNVNSWYNYNNYDQTSPYTQGVGIAFRKDFNNIRDLFKSKKKKSEKKESKKVNGESKLQEEDETGK